MICSFKKHHSVSAIFKWLAKIQMQHTQQKLFLSLWNSTIPVVMSSWPHFYIITLSTYSMFTPPLFITCRCEESPAESRMSLRTAGGSVQAQNSHGALHAEPYMLDCCIYWCPLRKRALPTGSPSSYCPTSPYSTSSPHACGIQYILAPGCLKRSQRFECKLVKEKIKGRTE